MKRFATLAFFFVCAATAAAQTTTLSAGPGPLDQVDFLTGYLNLSAAQVEQAKALFSAEREATTSLFDSMKQTMEALNAAEKSNQPDSEIDQLASAVGAVHGQLAAIHSKTSARLRMLLTADQKDKLNKFAGPMFGMQVGPGIVSTSSGHPR
jgi:Spy/CpxP family protein refolding chaperone